MPDLAAEHAAGLAGWAATGRALPASTSASTAGAGRAPALRERMLGHTFHRWLAAARARVSSFARGGACSNARSNGVTTTSNRVEPLSTYNAQQYGSRPEL